MAVSAIAQQSEDKLMRQAYQRRKDEIYFHNLELYKNSQKAEEYKLQADQATHRAEEYKLQANQATHRAEQAESEIEILRKEIAKLQAEKTT